MAFEKAFENTYHELNEETKYRFAEMELQKAIRHLSTLYHYTDNPRSTAIMHIYKAITPLYQRDAERESRFVAACNSTYFNNPPKKEQIKYLIIHAQSYNKIRTLTGASFNTIANERYGIPFFYPTYDMWTPEALNNWNNLKDIFNIWNERQVHNL